MNYLGNTDLLILSLLYRGDSYGYKISRGIHELSKGEVLLKETTLYAALNRLARENIITSYSGTETNGKARTYFSLTDSGKEWYAQCIRDWNMTVEIASNFIGGNQDESY